MFSAFRTNIRIWESSPDVGSIGMIFLYRCLKKDVICLKCIFSNQLIGHWCVITDSFQLYKWTCVNLMHLRIKQS